MIAIAQVTIRPWITTGEEFEVIKQNDTYITIALDTNETIEVLKDLFQYREEKDMNTNELVPFGELSPEEQGALLLAHHQDKPIEVRDIRLADSGFRETHMPAWKPEHTYRVKPVELTKPSIDWSHVHPDYKWMATDNDVNTMTCLYKHEPKFRGEEAWSDGTADWIEAEGFSSFKAGTCAPEDSLVERPSE